MKKYESKKRKAHSSGFQGIGEEVVVVSCPGALLSRITLP
jgi:hypothetical protein